MTLPQLVPRKTGTLQEPKGKDELELRTDEKQLIARILGGERELFHDLVRPYERRLYVVTYLVLKNEADAEEAAQEALLKAFKNLAQFRAESQFGSWLIQVGMNEARMRLRKRHSEIMRPMEDQQSEDGSYIPQDFSDWREIPSEALERKQVREMLIRALASLKSKYREVFVLRDVDHMSIDETAQTLGISKAAVKSRLLRARLMLRDMLAPGLDGAWISASAAGKGTKPWS